MGHRCYVFFLVFNVGAYRRLQMKDYNDHSYFSDENNEGVALRQYGLSFSNLISPNNYLSLFYKRGAKNLIFCSRITFSLW